MGSTALNLLLDTHIWIWSLEDPERLSQTVAAALRDVDNEAWLSPISIWEFLRLAQRGRVSVQGGMAPRSWVERALSTVPMRDAPLNREVAFVSRTIALEHEDPADRFIAATASVYELTLVTADERLLAGTGYQTLANR